MNTTIADLKTKAAELGGVSLPPKQVQEKTSVAFTFQDRTAGDKLIDWAGSAGLSPTSYRSTYHAFIATFMV